MCTAAEPELATLPGGQEHAAGGPTSEINLLRNSGLNWVDDLPEAKALFVRQALGLSGDLPELARV